MGNIITRFASFVKNLFVVEGKSDVDEDVEFKKLIEARKLAESPLNLPRGYLSVSQVSMYLRCALAYEWRYVRDIIRPPGFALVEGKAMHRALEMGLREKMTVGSVTPIDVLLDAWRDTWTTSKTEVEDWGEDGEQKTVRTIEDRGRALIKLYHTEHLPKRDPTGVEQRFWMEMGEQRIPILGYVDLIDKENLDGIHGPTVVDHKVVKAAKSQSDADSDMQLTLYAHATRTPRVRFDSFCKTLKPKIKTTRSIRTVQDVRWVSHVFDAVAQNISKGIFIPTDPANWQCLPKYCGYYDLCRGKKR